MDIFYTKPLLTSVDRTKGSVPIKNIFLIRKILALLMTIPFLAGLLSGTSTPISGETLNLWMGESVVWTGEETLSEKKAKIEQAYLAAMATTPAFEEVSRYNLPASPQKFIDWFKYSGIKAITYDGMALDGQKTKVFAYIGFPKNAAPGSPVPGIVLVHGGGGYAFYEWVKAWNDRGYAAIAMSNTGLFPDGKDAWVFGLQGDFVQAGYVNSYDNDGFSTADRKADNQWIYHAVGQTILAGNILRSFDCVDKSKIGISGISWGGVITSIAIGYDNRFAFAVPVYGNGYLNESYGIFGPITAGEAVQSLWMAQERFDKVTMPVLWLVGNDDFFFSVNTHSKCYADTHANNSRTIMTVLSGFPHGHGSAWRQEEEFAFADSVVRAAPPIPAFAVQPAGRTAAAQMETGAEIVCAKLYYITQPLAYDNATYTMTTPWFSQPLAVDGTRMTGTVPANAVGYYIECVCCVDGKKLVSASQYIEL